MGVQQTVEAMPRSFRDWRGAFFVEGAEDITLQHNTLTRLDGNGVFVSGMSTVRPSSSQRRFLLRLLARETVVSSSVVLLAVGYTRNVSITDSEFSWIGCNPMASWVSSGPARLGLA